MTVSFFVPGIPATKGSHKVISRGRGGRQLARPLVINDNPRGYSWARAVATMARFEMASRPPLEGAVAVTMLFALPRPKRHHRANGTLKPAAPEHPATRPDLDKLARSAGDALTGIVYRDDSQVVTLALEKHYALRGQEPGVRVIAGPNPKEST